MSKKRTKPVSCLLSDSLELLPKLVDIESIDISDVTINNKTTYYNWSCKCGVSFQATPLNVWNNPDITCHMCRVSRRNATRKSASDSSSVGEETTDHGTKLVVLTCKLCNALFMRKKTRLFVNNKCYVCGMSGDSRVIEHTENHVIFKPKNTDTVYRRDIKESVMMYAACKVCIKCNAVKVSSRKNSSLLCRVCKKQ